MTTPPPPWEDRPTSDDQGFFGAEPPSRSKEWLDDHVDSDDFDETDTGPVHVVRPETDAAPAGRYEPAPDLGPRRPAVAQDALANRFASMTVDPRTSVVRRARSNRPVLVGAAVVAGLVVVILVGWLLWPSADSDGNANVAQPPQDSVAVQRLKALLPAGYSAESCTSVEAPDGAEAKVMCGQNADADGPPTANYTLMKDAGALKVAMDDVISNAGIVNCPENTLSPGPWRRNATPDKVAGNLVCGLPQGKPMIAWTTDADSVLGMVRAGPTGPTLTQLYRWWSNHS